MKKSEKISGDKKRILEGVIRDSSSSVEEVRRAQGILLIDAEQRGVIFSLTGYSLKHVFRLRKKFLEKGIEAIVDQRKPAPKELLTQKQRAEIIEIVKSKSPNQCDFYYNNEHWTTGILGEFIRRTYNVQYKSKTSLYLIFRQSKFSYHKPGRVYEKRDEAKVIAWREEIRPVLEKVSQDSETVVLTEDEMVLSSQTTFQKIWLPQGEYPKIEISSTRKNRSVYGFLNLKTGVEHAFKKDWQNMFITVEVLKEIRSIYPTQKLLLLWDGAGWHRGSEVTKFLEADGKIQTIYYPAYSPEENPQEHVWKEGRSKVTHNRFIPNIDAVTDDFVAYLNKNKFPYKIQGLDRMS